MKKAYTPTKEQELIINDRESKDILVPASAGTGKTTVMIERIIKLLVDKCLDMSQLLVMTFTKQASMEMKQRLVEALNDNASKYRHLRKTIMEIDDAQISTIHSFCVYLVRNFFYIVGVNPSFVLLSEAESEKLKQETLQKVFNSYYIKEQEDDQVFYDLVDTFGRKRSDNSLKDLIFEIYKFMECQPDYESWFNEKQESYKNGSFMKIIDDDINDTCLFVVDYIEKNLNRWGLYEDLDAYAQEMLEVIKKYMAFDFKQKCHNELKFSRFNKDKRFKDNGVYLEFYTEINSIKKTITNSLAGLKSFNDYEGSVERMHKSNILIEKINEIAVAFYQSYIEEKEKQAKLDYSDLERLALKILRDPIAYQEVKDKYKYVFIDEYQDVNDIQEAIIELLSANYFFAVGDTKQSIYGFRESRPDNFLYRQKKYNLEENKIVQPLTANFRSNKEILDFVNSVFSVVMKNDFGGVDYAKTDKLVGSNNQIITDKSISFLLYEFAKDKLREDGILNEDDTDEVEKEECQIETNLIVKQIKSLLGKPMGENDGGFVSYKDITILARTKDQLSLINKQLNAMQIPTMLFFDQSFFSGEEVRLLVSFLKVLSNPLDDINFYALLVGPFVGFSQEQVAQLSCLTVKKHLYDRLYEFKTKHSQTTQYYELLNMVEKAIEFIERYILLSKFMSAGKILSTLINEKKYCDYLLSISDGNMRLEILWVFLDSVSSFGENCSVEKLLYLMNTDKKMKKNLGNMTEVDRVKLMPIHSSKGLEFPIVFVVGMHKKFNERGKAITILKENGIASKYYDLQEMQSQDTISMTANSITKRKNTRQEELRLLYVALTRAKYHLSLVGNCKSVKFVKPTMPFGAMKSTLSWVLMALMEKYNAFDYSQLSKALEKDNIEISFYLDQEPIIQESSKDLIFPLGQEEVFEIQQGSNVSKVSGQQLVKLISDNFKDLNSIQTDFAPTKLYSSRLYDFIENYNIGNDRNKVLFNALTNLNIKKTANAFDKKQSNEKNQISIEEKERNRKIIDNEYNEEYEKCGDCSVLDNKNFDDFDVIEYIGEVYEEPLGESGILPPIAKSKIGTAYHEVIERLNFGCSKNSINATIKELIIENTDRSSDYQHIDIEIIFKMLNDNKLIDLISGGSVYKEQSFFVELPLKDLIETESDQIVILQGVMDMLYISDDKTQAIIIDYKVTNNPNNIREKYSPQIKSYITAVKKILKIADVSGYIYDVKRAMLIEI